MAWVEFEVLQFQQTQDMTRHMKKANILPKSEAQTIKFPKSDTEIEVKQ